MSEILITEDMVDAIALGGCLLGVVAAAAQWQKGLSSQRSALRLPARSC
ncbi:hypothetical protein [Acetomicrobium sp.]|nr:hypothetical protein [Acetomicrobium sp.]MDR9768858.1 hypothetical protein [Acetomicrobium sp.]